MPPMTAIKFPRSRGVSGALYLQSAIAGVIFCRGLLLWGCPLKVTLTSWSYATGICEPCQVGNGAALSETFRVP